MPRQQSRSRVVYAGTRQVYGRPDYLPVDERHLVRPADINGVNKAAGEYYHLLYNNVFDVRACSLRLTNVYGPRQLIRHNRQGFIGWFIRLAIEDREIQVFGDGSQMRDFVLRGRCGGRLPAGRCVGRLRWRASSTSAATSRSRHRDLVSLLIESAGTRQRPLRRVAGRQEAHRHRQLLLGLDEISGTVGWRPRVELREGLRRTIDVLPRAHAH